MSSKAFEGRNCVVYLLVPFFFQLPGSMAQPCIVDGVDINTCDDDFKLNELVSYFWSFFPGSHWTCRTVSFAIISTNVPLHSVTPAELNLFQSRDLSLVRLPLVSLLMPTRDIRVT
jgi:hypothetical protein